MCGIIGYWASGGDRPDLREALLQGVRALSHRGPDDQSAWFGGSGVGLGHTRLAILDLSPAGAQPMQSPDGNDVIVHNGEIYNFREIAAELTVKGHKLTGDCDTEIILAAYREWGPDCVTHFIGMFAFAIWDGTRQRLRLFRDRVGIKPLYYGSENGQFIFGSELKALRALPGWNPEVNQDAVGDFLQYGYIGAPRSIYMAIHKLPAGHWLDLGHDGAVAIHRYWSLADAVAKGELVGKPEALEEELEALLESACRYRLVSDVPVGLFLSGGIDSSLIAALLHKIGERLETFTIGFSSASHDESLWAEKVAQTLNFDHKVQHIGFDEATEVMADWPNLFDEPFGNASGIPTYLVSRLARSSVKVAISADGGDELFCGYAGYSALASRMEMARDLPPWLKWTLNRASSFEGPMRLDRSGWAQLHGALGHGHVYNHIQKARSFTGNANGYDAIRPFRSFWQPAEIAGLFGRDYVDPRLGSHTIRGKPLEQITFADFHEYLADDVLVKIDRASMAVGLENREPLVDHRIAEFAYRLPLSMRMGARGSKHVLRSIVARHLSRDIVERPKQGFAVPLNQWMRAWLEGGQYDSAIESIRQKLPFINSNWLHGAGRTFQGSQQGINRLWLLYVLGQWAERWL